MSLRNSVIEDMLFSPRLLPFSLKSPVLKVACGPAFAAALTKVDGALLSLTCLSLGDPLVIGRQERF